MSVSIRPIEKNDLSYLNKWKNDESVYQYLGGGYQPISIDQQEQWLTNLIDMTGNNRRFIIMDDLHNPIGMVGLYSINWIHRTCEIGLFIGEKEATHKGKASAAYYLIENYALKYLNLRKINLKVVSDNIAGVSLWTRLGFVKVGELHSERYINGAYHNLMVMEKFINYK